MSALKTPRIRQHARPKSGLYPRNDPNPTLFVPTEDMWLVHEASKPSAIIARAAQAGAEITMWDWRTWREAEKKHPIGLIDWLRNPWRNVRPAGADASWQPTDTMEAFRKEATLQAIAAAAKRTPEQMKAGHRTQHSNGFKSHVSASLINSWLDEYRNRSWYESWQIQGADAPPKVRLVSAKDANAFRKAWDWRKHCADAGLSPANSYLWWITNGKIPDLPVLKWFFGHASPAGVFIVNDACRRLRQQMSQDGRLKGTRDLLREEGRNRPEGICLATLQKWKADEKKAAMLESLMEIARRSGHKPSLPSPTKTVRSDTLAYMWAFARASSRAACCERAGVKESNYFKLLNDARNCGVEGHLQEYLTCTGLCAPNKNALCGLIAPRFFIPSAGMLAFMQVASRAAAEAECWKSDLKDDPAFDDWFDDWTMPQRFMGKRRRLAGRNQEEHSPSATLSLNGRSPSASAPASEARDSKAETRRKSAAKRHSAWMKMHAEGMSYEQIRREWENQTGEKRSRDAVAKAITRSTPAEATL